MRSRHAVYITPLAALAGCGQMGPLYMPSEEHAPAQEQATEVDKMPPARPSNDADES